MVKTNSNYRNRIRPKPPALSPDSKNPELQRIKTALAQAETKPLSEAERLELKLIKPCLVCETVGRDHRNMPCVRCNGFRYLAEYENVFAEINRLRAESERQRVLLEVCLHRFGRIAKAIGAPEDVDGAALTEAIVEWARSGKRPEFVTLTAELPPAPKPKRRRRT